MEKTIVIYANKYGSTEKYAHWIGEELDCPVIELSKATRSGLDDYDTIIYGGGVHAGGIRGFDKFKKWIRQYLWLVEKPEKNIIIFAVGINVHTTETRMQLRDVNFDKKWLRQLTCFFMPGAFDPAKIDKIDNMVLKLMKKMLKDKGLNMTPEERELLRMVEEGCDKVERNAIMPLVEEVKMITVQ